MTKTERRFVKCAIGRLFSIMSRPYQPGDEEEYEKCRRVVTELCDEPSDDFQVCYVRDRLKGAAGD